MTWLYIPLMELENTCRTIGRLTGALLITQSLSKNLACCAKSHPETTVIAALMQRDIELTETL